MKDFAADGAPEHEQTLEGMAAAKEDWQVHISGLLSHPVGAKKSSSGRAAEVKILEKKRAAAYDHLRALDHTLLLASLGLADFIPATSDKWDAAGARPLQVDERRIYVDHTGGWPYIVPEEIQRVGKPSSSRRQESDGTSCPSSTRSARCWACTATKDRNVGHVAGSSRRTCGPASPSSQTQATGLGTTSSWRSTTWVGSLSYWRGAYLTPPADSHTV